MANIEYYGWLELSVEKFEKDPVKLEAALKNCVVKWNSSKSIDIQNRTLLHESKIRVAINNSNEWESIYKGYKKFIDEKIAEQIDMCVDGVGVPIESVNTIAENNNVSIDYIERIITQKGYYVEGKKSDTNTSNSAKTYTLKDMEPESGIKNPLNNIHNILEGLGYKNKDITDFIQNEKTIDISLMNCKKEELINIFSEIKVQWKKIPMTGKLGTQRTQIEKICTGMDSFFKKHTIDEYIAYLNWRKVKQTLDEKRRDLQNVGQSVLNDTPYNKLIDNIFSIIGDRNKAKEIVDNYCVEKSIGFPRILPKIAVCPFCANSFEKTTPIQISCPSCNKSFVIKCPKCGKDKNILVDRECDGINLQLYPLMLKRYKEAEHFYNMLSFNQAKGKLEEILFAWSGFPGVADLSKKCSEAEIKYGKDIKQINQLCNNGKYFTARNKCEQLITLFPESKGLFGSVYSQTEQAEYIFRECRYESDLDKKINMLLDIVSNVSDYAEVNAELRKYPIKNISQINAVCNNDKKSITISWKSANKPNNVNYHVLRKKGSPVANYSDGEEVVETMMTSYSDESISEGEMYYYAVYAQRGPITSPLMVSTMPVIYLGEVHANITGRDRGVDISWAIQSENIKVYYSENPIKSYAEGTEWVQVTPTGCAINNLKNGVIYYFAIYNMMKVDGKEYFSKITKLNCTPIDNIQPPFILKTMGSNDGEYIITYENNKQSNNLEFYYSDKIASITENNVIDLTNLQKKLKKLPVTQNIDANYVITMNGLTEMHVYPVIIKGTSAIVGNRVELRHIKPVKVTGHTVTGDRLCLNIEEWPHNVDAIDICINDDIYPQDERDCDKRVSITRQQYNRTKLIEIPHITQKQYYIALFARKNMDYIPVCNYYVDNSVVAKVYYSFSSNLFGTKIKLKNQVKERPELRLCIANGIMPLRETAAATILVIPASDNAPEIETFSIPGSVTKGTYGKLFTSNPSCQLILEGQSKIK